MIVQYNQSSSVIAAALVTYTIPHPTLKTVSLMHQVYVNACTCTDDFLDKLEDYIYERKVGYATVTFLSFLPTNHKLKEIRDEKVSS